MDRVARWGLNVIAILVGVRAAFYLAYAWWRLPFPLEVYALEGKMVLLAWRSQAGLPLYPDWRGYPHVANFFGPVYFLLVGRLGRSAGASLEQIFFLGRAVTFGAGLLASLAVGAHLGRRYGRGAGVVGAVATLGSAPMLGFSVMVRPDLLADTLGIVGYLLALSRSARPRVAGVGLLALAALTKQTAGAYLLAASLAWLLEGRWRTAIALIGGGLGALGLAVAIVTAGPEPLFARSLIGEAFMPPNLDNWMSTLRRLVLDAPDLLVFPVVAMVLWIARRPREIGLTTLAAAILFTGLVTAIKDGSDRNYFLGLRLIEGLAVGALWHASRPPGNRSSRRALAAIAVLGAAALLPGTILMADRAGQAWDMARSVAGPGGGPFLRAHRELCEQAMDPRTRLLTDCALFELYQKERAAFGDPYLFRMQVETGQIRPKEMRDALRDESYDLLITRFDIRHPSYKQYLFRLPWTLVAEARRHYVLRDRRGPFLIYGPRGTPDPPRRPD